MGVLIIGDDLKADIARIREHAEKIENWYRVDSNGRPKGPPPGDSLSHTGENGTLRYVFSITERNDITYRHLSISNTRNLPHPILVFTVAHLFGFTGAEEHDGIVQKPAKDWMIDANQLEQCIVLVQRIE